jgi:hypothetical protein
MSRQNEPLNAEEQAQADAQAEIEAASAISLANYLKLVRIDGSNGPRRFGEVMEPWQQDAILPIMRGIEGIAGITRYSGPLCFWRDLPQGHDKTSGIARILNGAISLCRKPLRIGLFAVDSQQAGRIHSFMKDESRLNPWLADSIKYTGTGSTRRAEGKRRLVEINGKFVEVGGGVVEINDSDANANAGHKYDVCVCEELTWWPSKGETLYDHLYARRLKIAGSVFVVLGNAGIKKTWQHRKYLSYHNDREWDIFRTEGSVASWMPPDRIAKLARGLIPSLVARLYDNRWISETEQTYLTEAELERMAAVAREIGVRLHDRAEPGIKYACAVDYGARKDWCACAVVGYYPDGTYRVAKLTVYRATDFPQREVPLSLVRQWCIDTQAAYNRPAWVFDEHQMLQIIQEFEGRWQLTRFNYRGGINNFKMAEFVRTSVINQVLLWPENAGVVELMGDSGRVEPYSLADEFHDLITVDMPYGYRWDHKANKHDDRATAVGMAAWLLAQTDPSQPFAEPGQDTSLQIDRDPQKWLDSPTADYSIWGAK